MPNSEPPRALPTISLFEQYEEPKSKRKKPIEKLDLEQLNQAIPAMDLMATSYLNHASVIDIGQMAVPSIREEDTMTIKSISSVIQRCKCLGGSRCFRKSHKSAPQLPCPFNVQLTQTNRHTVCNSCRKKKTGKRFKSGSLARETWQATEQTVEVTFEHNHGVLGDDEIAGETLVVGSAVPYLAVPVPHPPPQMY
jgi:hypothetical protein